jgi:hypothetical protein
MEKGQSAIEMGLAMIRRDATWRGKLGSGVWFADLPIGNGTMSLECFIVSDKDGNPENDAVILIGAGVHGQATHRIQVTLEALSDKGGLVISPGSWERS